MHTPNDAARYDEDRGKPRQHGANWYRWNLRLLRNSDKRCRVARDPGDKLAQARDDLLPSRMVRISVPAAQIGALNLVERQGRHRAVERQLDQPPRLARDIGLGAYPLRLQGIGRPDDDDGPCRFQPFLDHFRIGAVCRQSVIPPNAVAKRAQGLGNPPRVCLVRSGVGNEDVAQSPPQLSQQLIRESAQREARFVRSSTATHDMAMGRVLAPALFLGNLKPDGGTRGALQRVEICIRLDMDTNGVECPENHLAAAALLGERE